MASAVKLSHLGRPLPSNCLIIYYPLNAVEKHIIHSFNTRVSVKWLAGGLSAGTWLVFNT